MKLVVGLGNPGRKYESTRHNAGFWWIEELARREGAALRPESRFHGRVGKLRAAGGDVWLLAPETYMNLSGQAVQSLAAFYRIGPAEILVVHDELDLPPGTAKLKKGGGTGGHNGLRDIAARLGTQDFWRLRLGIGHPGVRDEVVEFVLRAPHPDERPLIEESLAKSLDLWPLLAAGDMEAAMLKLHTKAPRAES